MCSDVHYMQQVIMSERFYLLKHRKQEMHPQFILPSRFKAHLGDSFIMFTRIVSYLLVDQHTLRSLDDQNLCFLLNLLLIVLLAAAQTGSLMSQNSFSHNFLLTHQVSPCFIRSKTCSITLHAEVIMMQTYSS